MISIAMTSYNGEKYIEKQLLSILSQTMLPDELVIVDDCSKDQTVSIIETVLEEHGHKLSHVQLTVLSQNMGCHASFHKAISLAQGDIIFLCDQDDIWLPNHIADMVSVFQKNPNVLALSSGFEKIDGNDAPLTTRPYPFSSNHNLIRRPIQKNALAHISCNEVSLFNISPGCTSAFRSSIKAYLIDTQEIAEIPLIHDWKINLIAAAQNGLYFLNKPTIQYRIHQSNTLGIGRSYEIANRIKDFEAFIQEKENILQVVCAVNNAASLQEDIDFINEIIQLYKLRIERLQKGSFFHYALLFFQYKTVRKRLFDSFLADLYILLKHKFS